MVKGKSVLAWDHSEFSVEYPTTPNPTCCNILDVYHAKHGLGLSNCLTSHSLSACHALSTRSTFVAKHGLLVCWASRQYHDVKPINNSEPAKPGMTWCRMHKDC